MKTLPFPQKATVESHLAARFVAPLTVDGWDFSAVGPVALPPIAGGYLHRIVSYSFALEVPEAAFLGAVDPVAPFSLQVRKSSNQIGLFSKPLQLGRYAQDADALEYLRTIQKGTILQAVLNGRLLPASVDLLGYPQIVASVSFRVQICLDAEWVQRFERGEI